MNINKQKVERILDIIPWGARACYTGQSILAYCPDPTFTYEEMDLWEDQTDIDIFAYSHASQASLVQAYVSAGWEFPTSIEAFKGERIRFWEPNPKFNLQTVKLEKEGYPQLNISWQKGVEDALDCIKRFDMDYLMVSMDLSTKVFADLRGENKRVAHVNKHNRRFDPYDVNPEFWYRQFDRCPKGWSRGIDTRPVAEQYAEWIRKSLEQGDKALNSKTREYADRYMNQAIQPMIKEGFTEAQAIAAFHLYKGESNTWEAMEIKHKAMLERIETWLETVKEI